MKRFLLIKIGLFCCILNACSQNLTGTWQGTMDGNERIFIYIQMKNHELCGYTWDYEMNDLSSYCKAIFKGWYDSDKKMWMIMGTSFKENSGGHILMLLRLWKDKADAANTMHGTVEAKSSSMSLLNMGGGRGSVEIRKTSAALPQDMPDCFPKVLRPSNTGTNKVAAIRPLRKDPPTNKVRETAPAKASGRNQPAVKKTSNTKNTLSSKRDSIRTTSAVTHTILPDVVTKPKAPIIENSLLLKEMNARKKTELSHIIVNNRNITLSVYDNGIVDNDTVSIFYNGKLIADKKGLSEKPLILHITLDENTDEHKIIMFADNLGSIPPNTALIVVTAGSKRFELHSSASLSENAVFSFEYKPLPEK